jgi:hypothetical protein
MDPQQRATYLKTMIDSRLMTNTEAREKDDLPPLTPGQIAEFEKIYGKPKSGDAKAKPASGDDGKDEDGDENE